MPRVISQDDFESGISFMTLTISILVILLIVAGFAIVILARKDNDGDSIFDDDDEWDDEIDDDEKDTPDLPQYTKNPEVDYQTVDYSVLDKNQSETAHSTEHPVSEEE